MRPFPILLLLTGLLPGAERPELRAYLGRTPKVDGVISRGEYSDATRIDGVNGWTPQFTPTTNPRDLVLKGWVKHDGQALYFAFEISDDVLYGIDTERWLPDENPKAHDLTRDGYPWFGDEMEILINARGDWQDEKASAAGNGASSQMVCNLTKSRLGGIGVGGLMEGEPRRELSAWNTYSAWIREGAQQCVTKVRDAKSNPRVYVIEWMIRFNPCVEVEPGVFYSPAMGERRIGLNLALGDLDEKAKGKGNFGHFHHEDWWSGAKDTRTRLSNFGVLHLIPTAAKANAQR
jgi:SSS family solute:Na+ symporter